MSTYNTDPTLWASYKKYRDDATRPHAPLQIEAGHVMDGPEALGRFGSDGEAEAALTGAGFTKTEAGWV